MHHAAIIILWQILTEMKEEINSLTLTVEVYRHIIFIIYRTHREKINKGIKNFSNIIDID